MSPSALVRYARTHETSYVLEYIEALLDQREELRREIDEIDRYGYTEAARATVIRAGIAFAVFVALAVAYFLGQASR